MYQKSSDLRKHLIISIYIDFLRFCFPFFCIHWLMGYYANLYPELTTATVHGPELKEDKAVYEFRTTIGTKG